MGRKSRRKGLRAEQDLARELRAAGLADAARVPLSGMHGGQFAGDLTFALAGADRRAEVKIRAGGDGFKTLYRWLGNNDLLFVRMDKAEALAVLPLPLFLALARAARCPVQPVSDIAAPAGNPDPSGGSA